MIKAGPYRCWFIMISLSLTSCGQETDVASQFTDSSANSLEDFESDLDGDLDNQGRLILPNSYQATWTGDSLLGNEHYQIIAVE